MELYKLFIGTYLLTITKGRQTDAVVVVVVKVRIPSGFMKHLFEDQT